MKYIQELRNIDIIEQYHSFKEILTTFFVSYKQNNTWKLRLIDSFVVFCFILLILQLAYVVLNGLFPMNALLAGIISCIGTMTLLGKYKVWCDTHIISYHITVSLRFQVNPKTKVDEYGNEKAFAEFLVASLILYFVCINYLG